MSDVGELVSKMIKEFTDKGQIVEAGWQAYRMLSIPPNAPEIQVKECRLAYFFGAQHLFASMMGVLDEGSEPTDDDMKRLDNINEELTAFIEQIKAKETE